MVRTSAAGSGAPAGPSSPPSRPPLPTPRPPPPARRVSGLDGRRASARPSLGGVPRPLPAGGARGGEGRGGARRARRGAAVHLARCLRLLVIISSSQLFLFPQTENVRRPILTKRPSSLRQNKCLPGLAQNYFSRSQKNCVQETVDEDKRKRRVIDISCRNVKTGKGQASWSAAFMLKKEVVLCIRRN